MNNLPQVNEKGVLERMDAHNSAMLGCIGESLSLIILQTQSVPVFSFHASEGRESTLTYTVGMWLPRASVS